MSKNENKARTELSLDELDKAEKKLSAELTDSELEAIAGGKGSFGGRGHRRPRFPRR